MTKHYLKIPENKVPGNVRFDVPRRLQGQIIEIAYGGFDRYEHDDGAPYQRIIDRTDQSVSYYKLEEKENKEN